MMKRIAFSVVLSASLNAAPLIQQRGTVFTSSVSQVDVRSTIWQTDYGSYQRRFSHQRILNVKVHVVGEVEKKFEVIWYFFGKEEAGEGSLRIWGRGNDAAKLDASNSAEFKLSSPFTSGRDDNYAALNTRDRDGMKPFGWAVVLGQHGHVVASTGSTPEMAQLGAGIASEDYQSEKPRKPGTEVKPRA